jgi:hypothetical protein
MKPRPATGLREADSALAGRDGQLPALACVLDDDRLSAVLGRPVQVTRVRYKPQTSALVAFREQHGGGWRYGWAMTEAAHGFPKLQKRVKRSDRCGGTVRLFHMDIRGTAAVIASGGIEDDWALQAPLRWLRQQGLERMGVAGPGEAGWMQAAGILRYKPERRVVLRTGPPQSPIVVKTSVQPPDGIGSRLNERLARGGVPMLPELGDAECTRHGISASPMWGTGDLAEGGSPRAAFAAGEALAALHRLEDYVPGSAEEAVGDTVRQLLATHAMISVLLPELEEPAAWLAGRLLAYVGGTRPARNALVHGDFSADQVLVDGLKVRLLDFDRLQIGDTAQDLGSFAAVEEIVDRTRGRHAIGGSQAEQLLTGYCEAGGHIPQARVAAWAAFRLFVGCVDPFRDRAPAWPGDMAWQVARARELMT